MMITWKWISIFIYRINNITFAVDYHEFVTKKYFILPNNIFVFNSRALIPYQTEIRTSIKTKKTIRLYIRKEREREREYLKRMKRVQNSLWLLQPSLFSPGPSGKYFVYFETIRHALIYWLITADKYRKVRVHLGRVFLLIVKTRAVWFSSILPLTPAIIQPPINGTWSWEKNYSHVIYILYINVKVQNRWDGCDVVLHEYFICVLATKMNYSWIHKRLLLNVESAYADSCFAYSCIRPEKWNTVTL